MSSPALHARPERKLMARIAISQQEIGAYQSERIAFEARHEHYRYALRARLEMNDVQIARVMRRVRPPSAFGRAMRAEMAGMLADLGAARAAMCVLPTSPPWWVRLWRGWRYAS